MANMLSHASEPSTTVCISELVMPLWLPQTSQEQRGVCSTGQHQAQARQTQSHQTHLNLFNVAMQRLLYHVLDYSGLHFHYMDATMSSLYFENLLYLKFKQF